ncbi:MAG: hypothetical protein CMH27_03395 [Micavibrio sp.]|nr:hypothetical protein [Micavibrio sp.]|tara:strand:- start:3743 stop:4246 length:504 start_codon:yes stop_codon:yes gene_type:complete
MSQQKLSEIFDKPNSGYAEFEAIKPRIRQDLEMLGDVIQQIRPERVIELKENDQKNFTLCDKPKGLKKLTDKAEYIRISFSDLYVNNKMIPNQLHSSFWTQGQNIIESGVNENVCDYDHFRLKFFENLTNSPFFKDIQERQLFKTLMKQKLSANLENETQLPVRDIG